MSLVRALPWLVAGATVADVALARGVTGLVAVIVIIAALALTRRSLARRAWPLFLPALAFAASRAYVVAQQLRGAPGEPATAARTYVVLAGLACLALTIRPVRRRLGAALARSSQQPTLALVSSFLALIGAGSLLLSLPISLHDLADVSLLDALFTATSAVCVTGLTVNDVATAYRPFGQVVLLALIQLGGIGFMTLAALALTARRDTRLVDQARLAASLQSDGLGDLRAMVRSVVVWTVAIEALGTLLLALTLHGHPALEGRSLVWIAVFHSVSAFCNAGFSILPANLELLRGRAAPQLVVMGLVILGGLGFPVLRELFARARARAHRGPRLSLHTRVVLATSLAFTVGGAILLLAVEGGGVLLDRGVGGRLLDAFFLSVSARTAGFNTLALGQLADATALVLMVLMFVGGSPGSTAGGIKTTTVAILAAALRGELRRREPRLFDRAVPIDVLRRATAVTVLSLAVLLTSMFVLTLVEHRPFIVLAFETVSAFGTVGLSLGVTPLLGAPAKLLLAIVMFVGRVGPLTAALAVGTYHPRGHRVPPEDVEVG